MTVTKPYTSEGSALVFAPTSEISAAFLAQDLFSYGEGTGNRDNGGIAPCSNCREQGGRL